MKAKKDTLPLGKQKKESKKMQRSLQIITSPNAPFQYVEAYKTLRTNLNFMAVSKNYKKIVVTSSIPGEGKSNVAINLSLSLAETGKTVLLMDCDLRKPVLHKYLRINRKVNGLTSVLSGESAEKPAIVRFSDLGFDVMPAGVVPPNPAELVGSARMSEILETLGETYDYIIMDSPPASVVTDAAILGSIADGVIFVVSQSNVHFETALLAKKNLESTNANIIGAVFNDFDLKKSSKDTGYSYSYEYSSYE